MHRSFFVFCLLVSMTTLTGQKYSLSLSTMYGQIIDHTPDLLFEFPDRTFGFDVGVYQNTEGLRPWDKYWKKPKNGYAFGVHKLWR